MKRSLIGLAVLAGSIGLWVAPAAAASNPNTTGQPTQSCQAQPSSPGSSSSSPGAPFNEPTATSSGGTGGAAYNAGNANSPNSKAVSQYDVACYQVSSR
ncbi:MAG TPA: hypothetical protein VE990_14115 [Acidimicrobiales bacterium]|nr:hypothetical protein [Acidimicrobiales bacterium]